jgi:hypothetical protein
VILVFTFLLTFIAWIINFSICCNCGKNKDWESASGFIRKTIKLMKIIY